MKLEMEDGPLSRNLDLFGIGHGRLTAWPGPFNPRDGRQLIDEPLLDVVKKRIVANPHQLLDRDAKEIPFTAWLDESESYPVSCALDPLVAVNPVVR